ncbi:MAG: efflux RND transporter periplasmic adaptor subunit, partial [Mitsuokella jalaludinii]|nr:efflux RND transporter periplasmic adaptor subunit [Mitsuokella jalaludinii]
MTKKKIFTIAGIAVGAVIVIGIVIWLIFFRGGSVAPSDPNEMVYVTSVADITGTGSLGMTAKYSGVVEPEKTLSVQKDDTKKIAELYVTVGQEVKVGDKLFSYDTDDLQMQLEEAQLQLESLKNRISTLNQQIDSLQKEKNKASSDEQLSYTLQIQSAQLEVKSTEYDQSTKAKEIENLKKSLENTDVMAEMAGVVKQINDGSNTNTSGSDSTNAYITILATGSYRVKGTATELNVYSLQEGMKMKVVSRVDPEQTWTGTVESIEREAANDNNNSGVYYGSENSFTKATKYNFYLVLDDFKGLMLGQHVYVEPDKAEDVKTGIWLPSYYILNEGSKNYVWAVNDKNRIEKR